MSIDAGRLRTNGLLAILAVAALRALVAQYVGLEFGWDLQLVLESPLRRSSSERA